MRLDGRSGYNGCIVEVTGSDVPPPIFSSMLSRLLRFLCSLHRDYTCFLFILLDYWLLFFAFTIAYVYPVPPRHDKLFLACCQRSTTMLTKKHVLCES